MISRKILSYILLFVSSLSLYAQVDTSGFYSDKKDTLDAAVFTVREPGISKGRELRTEIISASGLMKMACCNLAESFENSASVSVGYSDATTGARQIRLLGLSGAYVQMLDENRPIMRGLSSPFGLSYVPGPWLESIQIAKGSPSVINGTESMTGQINLEYKKPTDDIPLFLNASVMSDTKTDINVITSDPIGGRLYTSVLAHFDGNFKTYDMNDDGFRDDPKRSQFNFANRWLYYTPSLQMRWGFRGIFDTRKGGMEGYDSDDPSSPWGTDVSNRQAGAWWKIGKALRDDNSSSIAFVADWSYDDLDGHFGRGEYDASQHSVFTNLIYRNKVNEVSDFTIGANFIYDRYDETLMARFSKERGYDENLLSNLVHGAVYGEYTFHAGETFTGIGGVSAGVYKKDGFKISPRLTLKYKPTDFLILRANGGRGLRHSSPVADNFGTLSTEKVISGSPLNHALEDSWTFGGNATFYLPFGADPENTYFSVDWFRTEFMNQVLADYEQDPLYIWFYDSDKKSYSQNFQADFNMEPFERFTVALTFRYTDNKVTLPGKGLVERPFSSRFKGVANLQYKTPLGKWVFDFTASMNGSSRVYDYMKGMTAEDGDILYKDGRTPVYPLLFAQVTRRFRGFDIYVGGENLTGYRQKHVIVSDPVLDASSVWGPIMGMKLDAGLRITIWRPTR